MQKLQAPKLQNGYFQAFALCTLAGLFIFLPFAVVDGGIFKYCGDFNSQQIPFYSYMNQFVKDGIGQFSWETDLGTSAVNGYAFYLLGSPFFWLSLLLPAAWTPYAMVPLLAIKFGMAGLGAYGYLRRYTKGQSGALLGACLYALGGFTVYNTFFNHFVDCIALFPFLLWALDAYVLDDVKGIFPLTVAINLINNYFFFAGQIVFLLIYFVWKVVTGEYKIRLPKFLQLAFESLLGCAMGCLLLWPAVLCLADNPRTVDLSSGFGFLMYSKVQQYFAIFTSLFLPPDPTYLPAIYTEGVLKHTSLNAWLPIVGVAGVLAYLRLYRQTAVRKILFTCAFMACVPVLNSAFYMLNSSYYARWYYMPILLMCLATAQALEHPDADLKGAIRTVGIITAAFAVFGLVPKQTDEVWSFGVANNPPLFWASLATALASLLIFFLIVTNVRGTGRRLRAVTSAVLAFSVFYGIVHVAEGKFPQWNGDGNYDAEMYVAARNFDWPQADEFYRIDSYECYDNISLWTGKSCLQFFNSVVTPSIMEFYPTVGVKRDVSSKPAHEKYALRALLGVRYTITPNEHATEFAEKQQQYGWQFYSEDATYTLFVNNNTLPMGFAYDTYITLEDLAAMSESTRSNMLVRAIALSEEQVATYGHLLPEATETQRANLGYDAFVTDVQNRRAQSVSAFAADASGFTASITLAQENLVFFSVPYDAGFAATVNGLPVTVEKVSNGMMAVLCPAGESQIIFTYQTPGIAVTRAITIGGFAVWALYLVLLGLQKRKKRRTTLYAN